MYFSITTIIAVIPYLVLASPIAEPSHTTIPLSKTSNMHKADGTLNAHSLRAQLDAATAKLMRGYEAYERNTGHRHPNQPEATSKRAISGEPLVLDDDGSFWKGAISVGTPPVTYIVDFDTGSSDTFLPSSDCVQAACTGHTKYNSSASSTSKPLGLPFRLGFGDGSAAIGKQFQDTVNVAGLKAASQTIGAATEMPGFEISRFNADGLVGMGFQTISNFKAPPLFQTLMSQGQVSKPVFAFKLADNGSELTLGGINSALYTGEPTYTRITTPGYWEFQFAALKVGTTVAVGPSAAIVDSGTSLVIGPSGPVKAFYAKIPGSVDAASIDPGYAGYTAFPCSANLPKIAFNIGGKDLAMSPSTFNLGSVTDKLCVGSIVYNDDLGGLWLLGDSFMKNYYTIHDVGHSRVGFATLK